MRTRFPGSAFQTVLLCMAANQLSPPIIWHLKISQGVPHWWRSQGCGRDSHIGNGYCSGVYRHSTERYCAFIVSGSKASLTHDAGSSSCGDGCPSSKTPSKFVDQARIYYCYCLTAEHFFVLAKTIENCRISVESLLSI